MWTQTFKESLEAWVTGTEKQVTLVKVRWRSFAARSFADLFVDERRTTRSTTRTRRSTLSSRSPTRARRRSRRTASRRRSRSRASSTRATWSASIPLARSRSTRLPRRSSAISSTFAWTTTTSARCVGSFSSCESRADPSRSPRPSSSTSSRPRTTASRTKLASSR